MPEQRKLKRKQLIYYLSVFDRSTEQRIGQLVNITTEGVMLTSENPIKQNTVFQLKMTLPEKIKGRGHITFVAKSMWCRKGINPDFYDIGFRLLDISQEDIKIIESLIYDFSFKS